MRLRIILGLGLFSLMSAAHAQPPVVPGGRGDARDDGEAGGAVGERFEAIDIIVDSGTARLAAYQFELVDHSASAKLAGVESGEHAAFSRAPYYDPAALAGSRIVVGAFDTGEELPSGKTRVARLHFMVEGEASYELELQAAAGADGAKIAGATAAWVRAVR